MEFDPSGYEYDDHRAHPPDLDQFYGNLHNYIRMVTQGYSNLLMLDAKGGLGKTHNVRKVLQEDLSSSQWIHQKGFTTPIELYKTLWQAREEGCVLFLDDMSGVTSSTKAIDMLKAATDTEGEENIVEYRTSRDIEHPFLEGASLPNTFTFRGSIILSFNDTPDNRHFDALRDRGTDYHLSFDYHERLSLVREVAKLEEISELTIPEQQQVAEWVADVTNPAYDVTIRTFEEVCKMRKFGQDTGQNWEKMALEVFGVDYEEFLVIRLRERGEMPVEEQIEIFCEKTNTSESHYYDVFDRVRDKRM